MVYVALLRAVNVGGTGALSMQHLARLCKELGFASVRTYIQSGNVVFRAQGDAPAVQAALEGALHTHTGRPVDVVVRTSAELHAILHANPFPGREGNKVAIAFLHTAPPPGAHGLTGAAGERIVNGTRELYIDYPEGMGRSKLKLPLGNTPATVRNLNTVTKLRSMAEALEQAGA